VAHRRQERRLRAVGRFRLRGQAHQLEVRLLGVLSRGLGLLARHALAGEKPAALDRVADRSAKDLAFNLVLEQVVLRALANCARREVLVVETRQHQHRRCRRRLAQPGQRAEAMRVGEG
jgi:hypothetical protein